jgi:hypothetical protein
VAEEFPRAESRIAGHALVCPVEGEFSARVMLLERE